MNSFHAMDIPENIEFINNTYYIYSHNKYIFKPNETIDIPIYLRFYIKSDYLLFINIDERLQSIFTLNQNIFINKNSFNLTLSITNKTNKTIIINKNEKFIKFLYDYSLNINKYLSIIDKLKNKNINNLITDNIIELTNNNLIFYN